jgi:putative hydrolase of the HAD superfamily
MLFFDLDQTILDFRLASHESLVELFITKGIELSQSQIEEYGEINSRWWSKLERGLQTKEEITTGRFDEFCEFLGVDFDAERLNERYLSLLSSKAYFLPGAEGFLSDLKRRGLRMAIITNGVYRVQHGRFQIARLERFFEFSLSSEEAGAAKPDPMIFDIALKMAGARREESIYIGDNLDSDYTGSKNAQLDFIWFHPSASFDHGPDKIARDFDELHSLLERLEYF